MSGASLSGTRKVASALVALVLLAAMVPATAFALADPRVTVNKDTGGQPTRFTFSTVTDADSPMTELRLVFPPGFDITPARADVVTLDGLKRTPVGADTSIEDGALVLSFAPPVAVNSQLRVLVYDVVTPREGRTYALKAGYSVESGIERTSEDLGFQYRTPSRTEEISRDLDGASWAKRWNSVPFLGLFLKPQLIVTAIPMLFRGWLLSIALVLIAFPIAIAGGLMLAFMKMAKVPPVRWIANAYINVIRGTPLFLQIFVAYIALPIAGVHAPLFVSGVIVLALNSSAYLAEIFRAGIQSIHRGQFEAASSLGMSYRQAMQYVIVPQTVKRVLPTMTSEFILLFKDTALLSAVGVFELMMRANNIVARTGNLTPFVVAAAYYLIVTIPLINLVARLEQRLALSEHGQSVPGAGTKRGLFGRLGQRGALTPPALAPTDMIGVLPEEHEAR